MKAVADAGPLINLAKLGLVSLLHQLYEPVLVPSPVYEEVVTKGIEQGRPDAYAVQLTIARNELVVVEVPANELPEVIQNLPLGSGERAAIYLGLREAADWLLLDDLRAREEAARLGLKIKGTLGVIVQAYRAGLMSLAEVEITIQAILARPDIWLNEELVHSMWNDLTNESKRPPQEG